MRAKYVVSAVATLAVAGALCTAWISTHPSMNGAGSGSSQAYAASPAATDARGPSASTGALPVRQWRSGDSFLYTVSTVRSASVGGGSQTSQKVLARLEGSLALTVTGQDPSGVEVRAELRSPRYDVTPAAEEGARASLVKPFYFTALKSGEMTAFYFAKDAPSEVRILLKGLTTALQLVAPPGSGSAWRSTEQDVSGEYEAAYRLTGAGVHKAKEKYLRSRGQTGLIPLPTDSVYAVKSAIDFEVDMTGWPRTVVEDESLDVTINGVHIAATSKTTAKLVSIESHPELAIAKNPSDFDSDALGHGAATALAKRQADQGLVGGKTFTGLRAELVSPDVHVRNRTQARMSALFRLDPAAPREAEEAILHGNIDENAKKRLLGGLGSAGTPEAQHALASILDGADAPRSMRVSAAVALGFSNPPTEEGEQAINKAMASSDKEIADTAALASGSQAHAMSLAQSGDPKDAVETLIARLVAAANDGERALYLRALGNSGDLRALPAILPYLTHVDATLRGVAAWALRFMIGDEVDALVIAAMADKEAAVRVAAIETVAFRPVAGVLAKLDELLRAEPEVSVRMAILNAMHAKRSEAPTIADSLAWAEENDPAAEVRVLAKQLLEK